MKNKMQIIKIKIIEKETTQKEMAEEIGVSEETISRWVGGEIGNIEKFIKLCKILDIDIKDL